MEEWKDIPGYEGEYQASNLGRIKSLKFGKEKILRPGKDTDNYLCVCLSKDGKQKTYRIHRIVAETFIDKIEEKNFVDHIDSNKQNNNVNNLRWCTQKENCNFELCKKHHSESQKGEKNSMYGKTGAWKGKTGKLHHKSKTVLCLELNKIYGSTMEAERETGINHSNIGMCCNGKLQSAGKLNGEKLHWRYL